MLILLLALLPLASPKVIINGQVIGGANKSGRPTYTTCQTTPNPYPTPHCQDHIISNPPPLLIPSTTSNGPTTKLALLTPYTACRHPFTLDLTPASLTGSDSITHLSLHCLHLSFDRSNPQSSSAPSTLLPGVPDHFFSSFPNLQELTLTNIPVPTLNHPSALQHLQHLTSLVLTSNNLTAIAANTLQYLPNLRDLTISSNGLTDLTPGTFAGLNNLQHLWILGNNIPAIRKDTFSNLHRLETLSLTRNHIKVIEDGAFDHLTALQTLFLDDNQLERLPAIAYGNLFLESVFVQNNMLKTLSREDVDAFTSVFLNSDSGKALHDLKPTPFLGWDVFDTTNGGLRTIFYTRPNSQTPVQRSMFL